MTLSALGIFSAAGAGGGVALSDYELISSTILGTATSSVTFSSLGTYSSTYKHLQIRAAAQNTSTSEVFRDWILTVNGAAGTSYAWHELQGTGSSVLTAGFGSQPTIGLGILASANAGSSVFSPLVVDALDSFSSTKNKTFRAMSGTNIGTSNSRLRLTSGVYLSTDSTTSITLATQGNFAIGSRFSLYGIKG
jgi:hypothetical protein